jgi:hypothetical protein
MYYPFDLFPIDLRIKSFTELVGQINFDDDYAASTDITRQNFPVFLSSLNYGNFLSFSDNKKSFETNDKEKKIIIAKFNDFLAEGFTIDSLTFQNVLIILEKLGFKLDSFSQNSQYLIAKNIKDIKCTGIGADLRDAYKGMGGHDLSCIV